MKDARWDVLKRIAVLCKERESTVFKGVFGPCVTLVPVPRSAPRRTEDTLWPGLSLANALHRHGLGREVQQLLVRDLAVPKAHGVSGGGRPTVSTLRRSLRWRGDLGSDLERVVLVDDVVTQGTTLPLRARRDPDHPTRAGGRGLRHDPDHELRSRRGAGRTGTGYDHPGLKRALGQAGALKRRISSAVFLARFPSRWSTKIRHVSLRGDRAWDGSGQGHGRDPCPAGVATGQMDVLMRSQMDLLGQSVVSCALTLCENVSTVPRMETLTQHFDSPAAVCLKRRGVKHQRRGPAGSDDREPSEPHCESNPPDSGRVPASSSNWKCRSTP